MTDDIRWKQRFNSFQKALQQLEYAVLEYRRRDLSDLEQQGVIQGFEITYELAWNLLKDYLHYQGVADIVGSRDAIRQSFSDGLVKDGHVWMAMLQDRNRTVHTYNKKTADSILQNIEQKYFQAFLDLKQVFSAMQDN